MPPVAKFSLSVPGQQLAQFTELAGVGQAGSVDFMRSGDSEFLKLPAKGAAGERSPGLHTTQKQRRDDLHLA